MPASTSFGKTSPSTVFKSGDYESESVGRILIRNAPIIKGYNINGVYRCFGHKKYEDTAKTFKIEYNTMKSQWRLLIQTNSKALLSSSKSSDSTPDNCEKGS